MRDILCIVALASFGVYCVGNGTGHKFIAKLGFIVEMIAVFAVLFL